jgi:hypothetical protein
MKGDMLLGVKQITQKFWQAEILRKPSKTGRGGGVVKTLFGGQIGLFDEESAYEFAEAMVRHNGEIST